MQVVPEDGKVGRPLTLNMCEVSVVMSIAERFFKSGARLKDMGVISPYTGHNAEIKKAEGYTLRARDPGCRRRRRLSKQGGEYSDMLNGAVQHGWLSQPRGRSASSDSRVDQGKTRVS